MPIPASGQAQTGIGSPDIAPLYRTPTSDRRRDRNVQNLTRESPQEVLQAQLEKEYGTPDTFKAEEKELLESLDRIDPLESGNRSKSSFSKYAIDPVPFPFILDRNGARAVCAHCNRLYSFLVVYFEGKLKSDGRPICKACRLKARQDYITGLKQELQNLKEKQNEEKKADEALSRLKKRFPILG